MTFDIAGSSKKSEGLVPNVGTLNFMTFLVFVIMGGINTKDKPPHQDFFSSVLVF